MILGRPNHEIPRACTQLVTPFEEVMRYSISENRSMRFAVLILRGGHIITFDCCYKCWPFVL